MPDDADGRAQGIDELRYIQQVYQSQYQMINNTATMHLQDIQALGAAQTALENSGRMKGKEVLTAAGANVYLKASIKDASVVLVGVGAGYFVEKGADDAKLYIDTLVKRKTDIVNNLTKTRRELQDALVDIAMKLEEAAGGRA